MKFHNLPRINIRRSAPTDFEFAHGLQTHYHVLSQQEYESIK